MIIETKAMVERWLDGIRIKINKINKSAPAALIIPHMQALCVCIFG